MKLENYKVRVSNEGESKEVQVLFFELGYEWYAHGKNVSYLDVITTGDFGYLVAWKTGCFSKHIIQMGCGKEDAKEINLPQLRDLVAAKTKKIPYLVKTIDKWEEQQLTSDTPESATCLKIPDGSIKAYLNYGYTINFVNSDDDFMNAATRGSWVSTHRGRHAANTRGLVWKRSTHPEELPFIDDEPKHDDNVNHPSHYTQGSIECIEALEAATVNKQGIEAVCVSNIIKYLWRYESKNGLEDVKKAQWYLQKLVDNLEQNNG